jgi:hypothetical protein
MELVIPGLADVPRTDVAGVSSYEVAPGATLEVHPLVPLPPEPRTWGLAVVNAGVSPDGQRLLDVVEKHTELGWPVTIAASEVVDPRTHATTEYRLHALYQFLELGGIAIVRAADPTSFAQALAFVQPLLPHAWPDLTSAEVPALALVWAGL